MRDYLIGYLLEALDPAEHEMVTAELSRDPQLKRELELLSRSLLPLSYDREHYSPPEGLAERTFAFVAERTEVNVARPVAPVSANRWTLSDMVVAAGLFIAATMLFFPALNQSRFAARISGCQDNLRQIGMAMTSYSQQHNGLFPNIPLEGRLAAAGSVSPRLIDYGFLKAHHVLVCPASPLAERRDEFRVPTCTELQSVNESQLPILHAKMGGSYGYNLGYVSKGNYQPPKNLSRARFALMADAPTATPPYQSLNHGGCGQNVLFEDLHVQYLTTCKAHGCNDDIYVNDDGAVAPGLHLHDAVIVPGNIRPRITPAIIELKLRRQP